MEKHVQSVSLQSELESLFSKKEEEEAGGGFFQL